MAKHQWYTGAAKKYTLKSFIAILGRGFCAQIFEHTKITSRQHCNAENFKTL